MLSNYLKSNVFPCPPKAILLRRLRQRFIKTLSPEEAAEWNRTRFLAELLKLGYTVATNGEGTATVVGVSFDPPLTVVDGKIVRAA